MDRGCRGASCRITTQYCGQRGRLYNRLRSHNEVPAAVRMPGDGLLSTQTIRLAYRHLGGPGVESFFPQRRVGNEPDSRRIMTAPAMTPFHIRRITSRLRAVSAVRRALAD